jgi:hypothetical protein
MGEKTYGQMLIEGFVRAIPWAIVFSITIVVTANMLAPKVKGAIQYTITASMDAVLDEQVFPKVKQNVKEAIEYTAKSMNNPPGPGKSAAKREGAKSKK